MSKMRRRCTSKIVSGKDVRKVKRWCRDSVGRYVGYTLTPSVRGVNVLNDSEEADFVIVTPVKMSDEDKKLQNRGADPPLPKVNGKNKNWNDVYTAEECLKMAREIFLADYPHRSEVNKSSPTADERLERYFGRKFMSRLDFQQKVVECLIDHCTGPRFGCDVKTIQHEDRDSLLICLSLDTDSDTVKLIADTEA